MTINEPKVIVERFLGLLANGTKDEIVNCFSDNGAIDMAGTPDFPWTGRWQGKEKLYEYFTVMPAALEMLDHQITKWIVDRNCITVTGTEHGRSRISGKEYRAKWAWVFYIHDGLIEFWDAYEDTQAFEHCGPWK
jgi:ketosteroid isomerase-like protein|tara:strand:+ start:155 stop:559 length:405 start_codon:yes stop_codon:yes gene_type:complete